MENYSDYTGNGKETQRLATTGSYGRGKKGYRTVLKPKGQVASVRKKHDGPHWRQKVPRIGFGFTNIQLPSSSFSPPPPFPSLPSVSLSGSMQVEAEHKGTGEGTLQLLGCQRTEQAYSGTAPKTMAFVRETLLLASSSVIRTVFNVSMKY